MYGRLIFDVDDSGVDSPEPQSAIVADLDAVEDGGWRKVEAHGFLIAELLEWDEARQTLVHGFGSCSMNWAMSRRSE